MTTHQRQAVARRARRTRKLLIPRVLSCLRALRVSVRVSVLRGSLLAQQVTFDRILHADSEPQNWLSYSGTVFNQRYSLLTQITPANVKNLELQWVWQAQVAREVRSDRARGGRRPLHRAGAARAGDLSGRGARRRHRSPFWTLRVQAGAGRRPVLRPREPRPGDSRRHAVHGHDRRASARDRRQDRQAFSGTSRRRGPSDKFAITHAPLVVKDKVIVGVAGGDFGVRGFIAAFDAKTGKEAVALLHDSRPRRARQRDVVRRFVEDRRRGGLEQRRLRSRTRTWCTSGPAIRRRTGTAASASATTCTATASSRSTRHRHAEVALPVHAARRVRLRLDAGADARRHAVAGAAAQGDAVGEPQRRRVRARSRHRRVPARQAVRQGELDGGLRQGGPAAARPRKGADAAKAS